MNTLTDFLNTATQGATGILGAINGNKTAKAQADAAKAQAQAAQQQASSMSAALKYGLIGGGVLIVLVVVGLLFHRGK